MLCPNTSARRPTRLRTGLAACLLSSTLCVVATAPSTVFAQPDTFQSPGDALALIVVTPTFPAGATAPPGGVRVDVTGTVRADGTFEPASITSEGDQAPYIAAVAGAVTWWQFLPAIDRERCAPTDATAKLSVWFEGSAAEPRIFVSQPRPKPVEPWPAFTITSPKWNASGRVEGRVRVLMTMSPEGRVTSARILSSEPRGHFDADVLRATRRTTVTWSVPPSRDVCMQREYLICLGPGVGAARHAACAQR